MRWSVLPGSQDRSTYQWLVGIALLLGIVAARPATAQFRDVGYTIEPGGQGLLAGDASAIQNRPLYGGALGLSFGRYFQASAEYFMNTGLTTDFSDIDRLD